MSLSAKNAGKQPLIDFDIEESLKRIENRIMVGAGSLIIFLAGVIVTLLMG